MMGECVHVEAGLAEEEVVRSLRSDQVRVCLSSRRPSRKVQMLGSEDCRVIYGEVP